MEKQSFRCPVNGRENSVLAQHLTQFPLIAGELKRFLLRDETRMNEFLQRLVHRIHAEMPAVPDMGVEVTRLAILQLLADRG